jgi:hypothetical protein
LHGWNRVEKVHADNAFGAARGRPEVGD